MNCYQEMCPFWTGEGCACDVLGIDRECHCGEPVDRSEYRNRGMCTHCDNTRRDAYPGNCGRQ